MIQSIRLMLISAVVLAWGATSLEGAVQLFADRALFEAATYGLEFEGFEEDFGSNFTEHDFDDFKLSVVAGGNSFSSTNEGFFVSEGDRAVVYTSDEFGQEINFGFTEPIYIFGIDINDWGTPSQAVGVLEVFNETNSFDEELAALAATDPRLGRGNTIFFGVIDENPFSSVTIRSTTGGDLIGLDNVSYGGPMVEQIPEPSSWFAWSGLALCGWAFGWRRRKQRVSQPAS